MAKEHGLQISFTGGDVSPATTRAKDLAQVITAIEDAVAITVIQDHAELRAENIVVGLTSIEEGSLHLGFTAPLEEPVYQAAHKLVAAVQNGDWSLVRPAALRKVKDIRRFAAKHNCIAQIRTRHANQSAVAVLTSDTQIPDAANIYGETELVGEIKRVGGVDPKVTFQTTQGQTLYCPTTETLAKELAHYLYERVKVIGVATVDFETLTVVDFEITRFASRRNTSLGIAFAQISKQYGRYFDEIDDVDAWCADVRHG